MKFLEQTIPGVYIVENFVAKDKRGDFVKTFHSNSFNSIGFLNEFKESYYSSSYKNVIRGMHFQTPPYDHLKLVYVTNGSILDVVLDLRKSSPTYKKCLSFQLEQYGNSVLIPKGCAHGFLTLSDIATVIYNVTTVYQDTADEGILWDSFGFDWGIDSPIMSGRDISFKPLSEFQSPFS